MSIFEDHGVWYCTTGEAAAALRMSPQTLRGLLNRGTAVEDVPKRTYISKKQRGFTRNDVERIADDLNIRIDQIALAELDQASQNGSGHAR